MASIRGPYGGAEVRGSIANVTFSRNGSGAYIRNRSVPVNPKTPEQELVRVALSGSSNDWNVTLTAAERTAWDAYAAATPLPNRFGDPVATSGRQMYLRQAVARIAFGLTALAAAPVTPGVAPAPDYTLDGSTTNGVRVLLNSPTLTTGDLGVFRVGVAVNPARNFYAAPYTFAAAYLTSTTPPLSLIAAASVAVGQRYFVEGRIFLADGKVSSVVRDFVDILA